MIRQPPPGGFAALLDDDAGHWSIRPAGAFTASRRYVEATMVLQTRFETPPGAVVLTDALATGARGDLHQLGAWAPHLLIRSLRCDRGAVAVNIRYWPRPEYRLVVPLLSPVPGGVLARGGTEALALSPRPGRPCPVMLTGDNPRTAAAVAAAVGISDFRAGLLPGEAHHGPGPASRWPPDAHGRRRDQRCSRPDPGRHRHRDGRGHRHRHRVRRHRADRQPALGGR